METHDDVEQFQCIICLELVYKPIVHACGHLFCFWCVHRAMDGAYKNLCPLCRRPYMHFPRICEQLHFVLLKAVRDKYLLRAKEVQEEEAQGGIFSPDIQPQPPRIITNVPLDVMMEEASSTSTDTVTSFESACLSTSSSSSGNDDANPNLMVCSKGKAPMPEEGGGALPAEEETEDVVPPDFSVTTLDLSCLHCGNLLYRPLVLNCGHMFCEHCVVVGDDNNVSCPSCKAEHPGMFPQACLELHHYIDRVFPLEYAQRSLQVAVEERERPPNRPQLPPSEPQQDSLLKSRVRRCLPGPVHRAVGCDGCGMMPIVGKRFRCQDCHEAIGFDLCQKCHESGCVVGRFNQRHTPEHRMDEVRLPSRGIARQLLDVMANRSVNLLDLRANDCNEAEALQTPLMQHRIASESNGMESSGAQAAAAPSAVEEATDDALQDVGDDHHEAYALQDGDDHYEDYMHSHGEDGEDGFDNPDDESEFEAFSRDDEDIDIFRVVFHS